MLKANIMLETKAITDYKDLILRVGEDYELFNLLWSNLIDEDLHASWFSSKVQELENKGIRGQLTKIKTKKRSGRN